MRNIINNLLKITRNIENEEKIIKDLKESLVHKKEKLKDAFHSTIKFMDLIYYILIDCNEDFTFIITITDKHTYEAATDQTTIHFKTAIPSVITEDFKEEWIRKQKNINMIVKVNDISYIKFVSVRTYMENIEFCKLNNDIAKLSKTLKDFINEKQKR